MTIFQKILLSIGAICTAGFFVLGTMMSFGYTQTVATNSGSVGLSTSLPIPGNSRILPDPKLTPGVTNPNITESNYKNTLCNKSWSTKSIRPSSSYTTKLKIQQIAQYGFMDTNPKNYEEDHLISLELGGDPTNPSNLWPESYKTSPNAHDKDKVQNYLHKQLCLGLITLTEAQMEISTNWVDVLNKISKSVVPANTIGQSDTDD